jgi:hypothetical protein
MMTVNNLKNDQEEILEHQTPVKAFAFLWARENAMLTAMAICEELALKVESEIEYQVEETAAGGLVFDKWHIAIDTLH